ncbi:MAG TPA: SUMF1/EgtB/PvdO family nonheme iron enzyme [Candidatus Acidoferrales bacterium]|nr:SUMF1/EgtB/PvdO family nonheme iron enzyme [Candidatus Acidoferrales bacterium]
MSSPTAAKLEPVLLSRMADARERTDSLFHLLPPNSLYDRPIPERHRMIFYLGHLEAFDWNLLSQPLGLCSKNPEFDKLFAFGIDPVGTGLPTDIPEDWPSIAQVEHYNAEVRGVLDNALRTASAFDAGSALADGTLLNVAIEHRLMHAETLAYLLQNMPVDRKIPQSAPALESHREPKPSMVEIPAGVATLGQSRDSGEFGWDNEFERASVFVPAFRVDMFPITNAEYLKFVEAGGYEEPKYWADKDWEWRLQNRIDHPHLWRRRSERAASDPDTPWEYRTMFGEIPLPHSWPVFVSHAEANAFCRWAGKKLPTEAQWHRAAYGTRKGTERSYPWGEERPDNSRGNFHHQSWTASPVDAYAAGASAFGVQDLLGNGWEWTSTPFAPLPGFKAFPFYPGYSANFFDGEHFVLKGGSQRTDACMLRRSFRNWFQPNYPYIYSTFRCVEE